MPPIRLEPPNLDLGIVAPKVTAKGRVLMHNTGKTPLKILAVTPSCKCTSTNQLAGSVIEPGKYAELEVALQPVSMPQTQKASVRVLIEGYGKILEIPLRGETAMPVRAVPSIINAVEGKARQGRFLVESIDKKPFTICAVGGRKAEYVGFNPEKDAPRNSYLVKYDLDTWQPSFPAYLVIETDRADCPTFDVWVRSENTIPRKGFAMKDYRVNAGRIDQGGTSEVTVEMDDLSEEVLAVECESDQLAVSLQGQSTDGKIRKVVLQVVPKGPVQGLVYAPFTMYGRTIEQPLVIFGTVRPKDATGCAGCNPADPPRPAANPSPGPEKPR